MDIVRRVQAILINPKEEWARIKAEPASARRQCVSYALILGAIPAVSRFVGEAFVRPALYVKFDTWKGMTLVLVKSVFFYVFLLAALYIFGMITNALAPSFSSTKNRANALKLAVYSITPVCLAGFLYLFPSNAFLVTTLTIIAKILAIVYGLYLLYLGFKTRMLETPKERIVGYVAVSTVIIAALWLLQLLSSWILAISLHI